MSRPFAEDHDGPYGGIDRNYSALPWQNGPDAKAPVRKRFELIPFDKIAFDTTPAYLVKGIVPRVGLCVFWGPPKCGKSFLVFDMLMHVALDWKYRGRRVQQGPVVYCAFEGKPALEIASRRSDNVSLSKAREAFLSTLSLTQ